MKLLYVTDNYFYREGHSVFTAGQYSASYWSRYLDSFEEIVVVGRKDLSFIDSIDAPFVPAGANHVSFVLTDNLSSIRGQLIGRKNVRRSLELAIKPIDVVIARLHSENGLLAIDIAIKHKKPWAVEVTSCAWDCLWNYGNLRGKAYAPVMFLKTQKVIRKAPIVVYVTKEFLQQRYPNIGGKCFELSDVDLPNTEPEILYNREIRIKKSKHRIVLGLIGTLNTKYKGIQTVLKAIKAWPENLPSVEFRILGYGDRGIWEAEALRHNVLDSTVFSTPINSRSAVMSWLDEIDIYLQPSLAEGLPRSLIEALSRGCPIIASRCGGIPELLDDECLIRPGVVSELRDQLTARVDDTQWQLKQARQNWTQARRYTTDVLGPKRLAAIREIRTM